jgi:hypothetical protein
MSSHLFLLLPLIRVFSSVILTSATYFGFYLFWPPEGASIVYSFLNPPTFPVLLLYSDFYFHLSASILL